MTEQHDRAGGAGGEEFHGRIGRLRRKVYRRLRLDELAPGVRRLIIGVVGGTLLLVGIAMVVLPGPALIVIPLSLALLASEFVWARRCINQARQLLHKAKAALKPES